MEFKVYAAEREAGLTESVLGKPVCFGSEISLTPAPSDSKAILQLLPVVEKTLARIGDMDLHWLKSVLVTTGWNKNDDVFDSLETWVARKSPEHKPFNYKHDCSDIIGHIVSSVPVTMDGKVIAEADVKGNNGPEGQFNLVTGAVLYKIWDQPQLQERMDTLLAEIAEGKWFVSMEALFRGFDYALKSSNGSQRIVARNEQTAFLTKHLRAYGGDGTYGDSRVGRVMRNIVFSGKGLVEKPANVHSIIFQDSQPFDSSAAEIIDSVPELGYANMTEKTKIKESLVVATELEIVTKQYNDLKVENEQLHASLRENDVKALKEEITKSKAQVVELATKLTESEQSKASLVDADKVSKTQVAELTSKLETADQNLTKANENLAKIEQEKKTLARVQMAAEKLSLPSERATILVANLSVLNDEQFKATIEGQAQLLSEAKASVKPAEKTEAAVEVDPNEQNADTKVLETAVPDKTNATLSHENTNSGVEKVQADIAEYFGCTPEQGE